MTHIPVDFACEMSLCSLGVNSALDEQLVEAAKNGDLHAVRQLLGEGTDPKAHDSQALRMAAKNGHPECVRLLIPVSDPKANDSWALYWAAANGHTACVELLIPVSAPKATNSWALRLAAIHGHTDCVRLLIPVSDPKARNSWALRRATEKGYLDMVDVLFAVSEPQKALEILLADVRRCPTKTPQDYPGIVYLQQKIQAKEENVILQEHIDTSSVLWPQNTRRQL